MLLLDCVCMFRDFMQTIRMLAVGCWLLAYSELPLRLLLMPIYLCCVLLGTVDWMPTTAFLLLLFFFVCFCVDTRANVICSCTRLACMQYDDENRYESNNANEWTNKNIVRKFQRFECVCKRRRRRHQHHNNNMIRRSILRHIGYLSVATMQTNGSNDTLCRCVQSVHMHATRIQKTSEWMNEWKIKTVMNTKWVMATLQTGQYNQMRLRNAMKELSAENDGRSIDVWLRAWVRRSDKTNSITYKRIP